MNFIDEIKNMKNNRDNYIDELKYLENQELNELLEVKKIIQEKYKIDKEEVNCSIQTSQNELVDYYKKIVLFSKFALIDIEKVIGDIINIYEGEPYIYQQAYRHIDMKRIIVVEEVMMFVKKDKMLDKEYSFHYFNSNLKHGNLFVLKYDCNYWKDKEIYFYKYDRILEPNIKYGRFNYIKEFIDYVINYKIENSIINIDIETLNKLKIEFIELKINDIYNHHDKLNKLDEKKYKLIVENNKLRREKQVKRLLRNK